MVCDDPQAPTDPHATIVLAGGSHAGQYHHAFRALAETYNWELLIVDRSNCYFQDTDHPDTDMCSAWQTNFMEWLEQADVDLVVTPGTRMSEHGDPEYIAPHAPDRWQDILDTQTDLLLIRGVPRHTDDIADCMASAPDLETCGPEVAQIANTNPLDNMDLPAAISTVDFTEHVCPAVNDSDALLCSPIVGNVAVWRDYNHLSNQFVETMTPVIEVQLRKELPWLFQ